MAQRHSNGHLSGKLGNLVYYTLNGKQVVRTVPPVTRQTKGTKKWCAAFGKASKLGGFIRKQFGFLHEYWNITDLHERLTSAFSYWFREKHQSGEILNRESFNFLQHFPLGKNSSIKLNWSTMFEISGDPVNGLQLKLHEFSAGPVFDSHYLAWRVEYNVSAVSFEFDTLYLKQTFSHTISIKRPHDHIIPAQQMPMNIFPVDGDLTLVMASVSIYDSANKLLRRGNRVMQEGEMVGVMYEELG